MVDIPFEVNLHTNQQKMFDSKARFKIVSCGRRFGKTWFAAYELLLKSAFVLQDGVSWVVSPRYKQTMIIWRRLKKIIPPGVVKEIREGDKYIELTNGHQIWAMSADDPDSLRGEGLDFVVIDEAAMIKEAAWIEAIQPALMDKKGKAILISTPKGLNFFYDLYCYGESEDPMYSEWESFKYSSYDNPYLDPNEIDMMVRKLPPHIARQEIFAEFLTGTGEVFPEPQWIERTPYDELPPLDGFSFYVSGLDLASIVDYTVHSIFRYHERGNDVKMVEVFRQRYHGAWDLQLERIKSVQRMFGNPACFCDVQGIGEPVVSRLALAGVNVKPMQITAASKPRFISNLIFLMNQKIIYIIHDPDVEDEYKRYQFVQQESGHLKYSAPSKHHDDIIMAHALAAWAIHTIAPTIGVFGTVVQESDQNLYDEVDVFDYNNGDDEMPDNFWDD